MSLMVNPGPISDDLLFLANNHRARALFTGHIPDNEQLNVRRGDLHFWEHVRDHSIPASVMELIGEAGFGGVIDCGYRTVDHGLVTALVERWRPETHTFHLPFGEVTVTLQDVQILWGLPVNGEVVTGVDYKHNVEDHIINCQQLLGFTPQRSDIKGGRIKLTRILEEIKSDFPEKPTNLQKLQRARLYILHLLGATLFPGSANHLVHLNHLGYLIDLQACGGYSWGSAVLACLYRNLCKATNYLALEICGPVYLLQIWAWERIQILSPLVTYRFDRTKPFGARWRSEELSYSESTSHLLKGFRSQLTDLHENMFNWTPYKDVLHLLSPMCTSGHNSWMCNTYIVYWEVVEYHAASRVARQFGFVQKIPPGVPFGQDEHRRLHTLTRQGKSDRDWKQQHLQYITLWNGRFDNVLQGDHSNTPSVTVDYMAWFRERTVLYITNPGSHDAHPHGYQNHGGRFQVVVDGVTQMYQMTGNLMGSFPENSQHFEPLREMATSFMEIVDERQRLNYQSTNLTRNQVDFGGANLPQRARTRERRRGGRQRRNRMLVDDDEEEGGTSNVNQNRSPIPDEGGPSNVNQTYSPVIDAGGASNFNQTYSPVTHAGGSSNFNVTRSPMFDFQQEEMALNFGVGSPSFFDLLTFPHQGQPSNQQAFVTPLDSQIPPVSQDDTQRNYFAHNQDETDVRQYSSRDAVPFDLDLNDRPRRNIRRPGCGT